MSVPGAKDTGKKCSGFTYFKNMNYLEKNVIKYVQELAEKGINVTERNLKKPK